VVQSKTSAAIVRTGPAFINAAGSITNIAIGEFRCVSLIRSLAGSYRSKHYHQTDEHVLYVSEGRMLYWERELDGEYGPPIEVHQGEAVRTGPLVVHQTYFPVNTLLISMSRNPRDSKSHEADVVRVEEPWQTALIAE
jgi:mannose-6-phosphate isomerase-like protein (cupin superfamily)